MWLSPISLLFPCFLPHQIPTSSAGGGYTQGCWYSSFSHKENGLLLLGRGPEPGIPQAITAPLWTHTGSFAYYNSRHLLSVQYSSPFFSGNRISFSLGIHSISTPSPCGLGMITSGWACDPSPENQCIRLSQHSNWSRDGSTGKVTPMLALVWGCGEERTLLLDLGL